MRLAIIADIHSNFPALEAVMADIKTQSVDEIIVAGDTINAGAFPCEVLDVLRSENLPIVLGNHEQYVLDYHQIERRVDYPKKRWGSLHWTLAQITQADIEYIQTWPTELVRGDLLIVHGSPNNLFGGIQFDAPDALIEERFGMVKHQWVITAHTHNPFVRQWHNLTLINPGSIGMPLDGNPDSCYAILTQTTDSFTIQHRRVSYNRALVEQAAHRRGLLEMGGGIAYLFIQESLTGQPVLVEYFECIQAAIEQDGLTEDEAFEIVPLLT